MKSRSVKELGGLNSKHASGYRIINIFNWLGYQVPVTHINKPKRWSKDSRLTCKYFSKWSNLVPNPQNSICL